MLYSRLLVIALSSLTLAARFKPGPKHKRFSPDTLDRVVRDRNLVRSYSSAGIFYNEGQVWLDNMPSLLKMNITVPGVSPLFPDVHCTANGDVCQLTLGEGEINAASSIAAVLYSGLFNLKKTYFFVAGIAGINPHVATTGAVTFPRYAVQFDLQYEFDARQIPKRFSYGYVPQGSYFSDEKKGIDYPGEVYGTEAFELNKDLRDRFFDLAKTKKLSDTTAAMKYRKKYGYAPANQPPTVVKCATGTANTYWSGSLLGEAFAAYTKLLTNGTATYCATQQEDNAILEVLLRGDLAGKVDYARVAIIRTASDFDRAPPTETEVYHLLYAEQEGFGPSIDNIFVAGHAIVMDVVKNWKTVYEAGIKPTNYIGDLFNTLARKNPDIGTESIYIN